MRKISGIDREKIEAISYELLETCAKNGLTIAEMVGISRIFPLLVNKKIKEMEQRISFAVSDVQG